MSATPRTGPPPFGLWLKDWGGKLESFDFSFGDFDAVVILEVPNNVAAASIAMAVGASGAISSLKTTVLVSMEEAMEAMRQASGVDYRSPGA